MRPARQSLRRRRGRASTRGGRGAMTDTAKATARRGACPRCRHAGPQHTAPGRCLHCTDRRCDWWPVSAYEYDALKAVEAAARAAFVVLNATMTHRPSAERLHAALAALDAIRKGG